MLEQEPENQSEVDELNWLAFRYVSGEFDESDVSDFEQRLGTSQSAREAVVRAVRLSDAVASAYDQNLVDCRPSEVTTGVASETGMARIARRLSITAAAVAIVATCWLIQRNDSDSISQDYVHVESPGDMPAGVPAIPAVASDLVRFWADTESDESRVAVQSASPVAREISETTTDVPDWLIAALLSANETGGFERTPEVDN